MNGADTARDALHRALEGAYNPAVAAGTAFAKAWSVAKRTTDIEAAMSAAIDMVIAAEALEEAAWGAAKAAREALAQAIQETGAPEAVTMHHKAYLAKKAAWVSVDQPDMLPAWYWNAPTPDKKAIKAAIEHGDDVPGCTLVRPNEQSLVIRARK